MLPKIKYGKMLIVIFLTALIWIWADLALDDRLTVPGVAISVVKSPSGDLWASFDDQSSVALEEIVLKGPASKIAKERRRLSEGSLNLDFYLDVEAEGMTESGRHSLNVLNFLKRNEQIKRRNLTIESCKPSTLNVEVVQLVEKTLDVECVGEDQTPIKTRSIDPSKVNMLVPQGWEGEKLKAYVTLTRLEMDQAISSGVSKSPYIILPGGQLKYSSSTVKITAPPEEDRRIDYTITKVVPGFNLSTNLQAKYRVVVTNLTEVTSAIAIKATPQAKRTYENIRYQVILEIDDGDIKSEETRRELVYNFPQEYVRNDEIRLNQQPVTAQFKLVPLAPDESGQ